MKASMIRKNDLVLFQGDSITDSGRQESTDALGSGYVAIIKGILAYKRPDVRILNRGVNGDRSQELLDRWKVDCENIKPQILSIMIGVNDVWRIREAWNAQPYINPETYLQNYQKLLDKALAAGVRDLVLMSATTIGNEQDQEFSDLLDERAQIVQELAKEYKATYVPTRETQKRAFMEFTEVQWTLDGCHPTIAGHSLIAQTWIDTLGL